MKQVLVVIVLSLISVAVQAQSRPVEGFLFDLETQKPIAGAELITEPGGTVLGVSDSSGWFSLVTTSKSLKISHISYEDEVINVGKFVNGTRIEMLQNYGSMLNRAVIGADRRAKTMKEQIVSVEVVNPDLIAEKNPITIDEIANQVSGVVIQDGQISIRNGAGWSYGAGTRALVMVDGMPLMSGDAASVQWSFISTENIRSMEVVKGASSVLYGSSALNGMINIQTAWPTSKPKTKIVGFHGVYSKGSRETLNWTNKALFNSGLRMVDSRRIGKSDLVTTVEYIDDQGYRFGDFDRRVHAGLDYRRKTKAGLQYGVKTHLLSTSNGSFLLWKSYDSAYNAQGDQTTATDGFKMRIDPFLKYYRKGWSHNLKARFFTLDNQVDNGDPNNDQSNTSNTFFVDYQSGIRMMSSSKLTYGVTYSSTKTRSPLFSGDQTTTNLAYYAQFDQKLGKLSWTFGTRWEKYTLNEREAKKPVIRTGLNYALGKASFFRFSYGEGFRFPTIAESFITTSVGLVSVFPNPELRPETGNNIEIGLKQGYKISGLKLKGYIDVAAFRMRYEDMMEFTFSQWSKDVSIGNGLGLGFKSVNTGNTQISGLDMSIVGEMKVGKSKVRLFGGYTLSEPIARNPEVVFATDSQDRAISYLNTSSDTTDNLLKYRNRRVFRMDVALSGKRFECGISSRYMSRIENIDLAFLQQPFTSFVPGIETGLNLNPEGVWVWDMRVAYKLSSKYKVALISNNVFNKEYLIRPADIAAPRLVMIQLRATL